jgi:hypothetical protein
MIDDIGACSMSEDRKISGEELIKAINLLESTDEYVVIKLTSSNKRDHDECCSIGDKKDCTECSCSGCIVETLGTG